MITTGAEETRQLGARLAQSLVAGDVLVLRGRLGAGKSELARGVARGLGVSGRITSPTFTIMQLYDTGRLPFYHFDWYRISDAEELYELSLDEYLYGEGVSVIEWPSMAEEVLPERRLEITITPLDDNTRDIALKRVGGFHEVGLQAEDCE